MSKKTAKKKKKVAPVKKPKAKKSAPKKKKTAIKSEPVVSTPATRKAAYERSSILLKRKLWY